MGSEAYVMRSLRSLPFLRPPKAILVPGMNFLGFSRYLNCLANTALAIVIRTKNEYIGTYQSVLVPGHTGLLVGIGVGVALDLTSLTAEEAVEVGADFVGTTILDSVALLAAGLFLVSFVVFMMRRVGKGTDLEELGTLLRVTWRKQLISILFRLRFLQFFYFELAHAESGSETVGVEAGHDGHDVKSNVRDGAVKRAICARQFETSDYGIASLPTRMRKEGMRNIKSFCVKFNSKTCEGRS